MPTPRAFPAVAVLGGQVYVIGGRDASGTALGVVERYDPASNAWAAVEPLRRARSDAAATVLGGRILLAGGREDDGVVTKDVEVYVPAEDDWESFDDLEHEREGHAAFTVGADAYIFGGANPGGSFRADAEYYDGVEEEWYEYPDWVLSPPRAAFASVAQGGGVLLIGGFSSFGALATVEFYVPGQGGVMRARLPEARGALAAAAGADTVWAIGGRTGDNDVVARVDVYDRTSDTWTDGLPLPAPREGAVATVVDGVVYVFGGQDGALATSSLKLGEAPPLANETDEPDAGFALTLAGPNPFRAGTRLALRLDRPGSASVAVYDVLGRQVAVLHDGPLPAGRHTLDWNGAGASGALPAGLYSVRAVVGEWHGALRLTLVR